MSRASHLVTAALCLWFGACGPGGDDDGDDDDTSTTYEVVIVFEGSGGGRVVSSDGSIDCAGSCSVEIADGTALSLSTIPSDGARFVTWGGACDGDDADCELVVDRDVALSARFTTRGVLRVEVTGDGEVHDGDGVLACPGTCAREADTGEVIELTAAPASGWVLASWAGACDGTGPCQIAVGDDETSVAATFATSLRLDVAGNGHVEVTGAIETTCSAPGCDLAVALGGTVTLRAVAADEHAALDAWTGACADSVDPCELHVDDRTVAGVQFGARRLVTVTGYGSGAGTVTSSPAGIDCGDVCQMSVPPGTHVTLSQAAAAGSAFGGWGGRCGGTGNCTFEVVEDVAVDATFLALFGLTISVEGSGRVMSDPVGVDCGPTCNASFPDGAEVSLWVEPGLGYARSEWAGDCTGDGDCALTIDGARAVSTRFDLRVDQASWFSGPGDEGIYDVAAAPDGALTLCGSVHAGGALDLGDVVLDQIGGFVVQLDPDGAHRWHRVLSSSGNNHWVEHVARAPTGHVYATGYVTGTFDWGTGEQQAPLNDAWTFLLRLDPTGQTEWLKLEPQLGYGHPEAISVTSDGGVVVVTGEIGHEDVAAFGPDGAEKWRQTWTASGLVWGNDVEGLADGGVIVSVETETGMQIGDAASPCNCDAMVHLGPDGTIVWIYFDWLDEAGFEVLPDRIIAAGYENGQARIVVLSLDGVVLEQTVLPVRIDGLTASPLGTIVMEAYVPNPSPRIGGVIAPAHGQILLALDADLTPRWIVPVARYTGQNYYHRGELAWLADDRLVYAGSTEACEVGVGDDTFVATTFDSFLLTLDAAP